MDMDSFLSIAEFLVVFLASIYLSLFFIFSHHKNKPIVTGKSAFAEYAAGVVLFLLFIGALFLLRDYVFDSFNLDPEVLLGIFILTNALLAIGLGVKRKYVGIGYIMGMPSALLLVAMVIVELFIHPPDEE